MATDYILVAGATGKVTKYLDSDLSFVEESAAYGASLQALIIDTNGLYCYAAGANAPGTIVKYQIDGLGIVATSPSYGGRVYALAQDDNYIYAGGDTVHTIKRYNKADLTYVDASPSYGGYIGSLLVDDTYVLAGGYSAEPRAIRRYLVADLSYVDATGSLGADGQAMDWDDDYFYVRGSSFAMRKYARTDMSLVKTGGSYDGVVKAIVESGLYVYAAGATTRTIRRFQKSDMAYISQSANYGGNIYALEHFGINLYIGGASTQTVQKRLLSDFTLLDESPDYGGTIYAVRGVSYDADVLPQVTTDPCSDVDEETATGNGEVTSIGATAVTQHGHCWSTNQNPTTADDKTENGAKASIGTFTSAITGLNAATTYYVRAYATNGGGTSYGEQVTLVTQEAGAPTVDTQECTDVQSESATGNGSILDLGDSAVTQHGHVWATTINPTTANFKTENGAGSVGVFTSALTSLTPGQTYYVRAYATNTQGTSYGDNVALECPTGDIPTVTTQACSALASESATGNGNITAFGDDTPSAHGHCWSTSQYPTLSDDFNDEGIPFAPGAFTSSLTALVPNTRYYIRAYATNAYGTAYGNQVSIFTYPGGAVIVPENPVDVDWADDGNYIDIASDVMEAYIEFGKDRELNEAIPALLSLTVDNYDHKYSPPNAASPYNTGGNTLRAGHRIRLSFAYPFDDFEDVDGTLIENHIIPKDNQFEWSEESGTWSLFQGALLEADGAGIAVIEFGEADAHIQVDFTKGADNDGIIVFRYSDTSNFLYVRTDGTNLEVRKVDGGADSLVDEEALAWADGVEKTIKVILHGAYIYVVADNTLIVSTSSAFNQTETEHGVGGASLHANARWNNFGGIYSLFYGTIDRIIPYPNKERQTCLIEASDDLKILGRHILYRRAYAYTGYPGGMRAFIQEVYKNTANVSQLGEIMDIGETISTSPYKSWWGISGLQVCRNVEREENGFFYQDQESFWRFEAKGHRAAAPHDAARCIFYQDYDTNDLAFTGFKWISGEDDVVNMVSVHVQKSVADPLNLATGGQTVWRCAEADVLDGGIAASQLEIPASSAVTIYFESKDFETLEDLINPAVASAVYTITGTVTNGPFLEGEGITTDVSGNTGTVLVQKGGTLTLGDCDGAFNAGDTFTGTTSGATMNGGVTITAIPDYQANADADGGGADKTGNLTVVLSYPVYNSYGRGGKLVLTNDDVAAIYVTRLLVRGDGYNLQDRGSVYVEDATSKTDYGEHSLNIDAEILTSLAEAKTLADDIKSKEIAPRSKVELTLENYNKEMLTKILSLKLSDRITANYSDMGVDEDFFINKIIYNISQGGLLVEAVLKCEQAA